MSQTEAAPKPDYRPISGIAESQAAIEEVVSNARQAIRVFDISLSNRGFNSPGLTDKLRQFVVAGLAHRSARRLRSGARSGSIGGDRRVGDAHVRAARARGGPV